jgi:hypothetical protein
VGQIRPVRRHKIPPLFPEFCKIETLNLFVLKISTTAKNTKLGQNSRKEYFFGLLDLKITQLHFSNLHFKRSSKHKFEKLASGAF